MLLLLKRKTKNLLIFSVVVILVLFYVLQNYTIERGIRLNDDNPPVIKAPESPESSAQDSETIQTQAQSIIPVENKVENKN